MLRIQLVYNENILDVLQTVVFQLDTEKLYLIIKSLNPEFQNVIEFCHESCWTTEVLDELTKNNITLCSVSYPKLPTEIVETSKIGYVRLTAGIFNAMTFSDLNL